MVNLTSDHWDLERSVADNVRWVRHNFVRHALPFPNASFDFVRLSNLGLAVPFDRWAFVLTEAHRVLAPGGRLELIDDQMCFPFISPTSPSKSAFNTSPSEESSFDLDIGIDSDEEAGPSEKRRSEPKASPYEEWEREMQNCGELEDVFDAMLTWGRNIHRHPATFLRGMLSVPFEEKNVRVLPLHVGLPSREFMSKHDTEAQKPDGEGRWAVTIDWEKKDGKDKGKAKANDSPPLGPLQPTDLPPMLSKKAAAMLGTTRLSPAGVPYQQPGLILYPETFLPMSPDEVEMHSSKNLHVLLSCRAALKDFIRDFKDKDGKPLATAEDLEDSLWDYEIFRRRRFNWPADLPELRLREQFAAPPTPPKRLSNESERLESPKRTSYVPNISNPTGSREGLTFVRSFRIFQAVKMSPTL
ncbi:hypothetical protein BV25DRAFT_1818429 [Artomyces pyxidatus]|uniref:Uncharacterized protein n=1 Tax=Artomyces pyxidatus TaxID=48021 RepID=A0ACB8THW8_9AGAM|nr:hypothetical protein BV25DRAFT_1818429 [Artomyces pyxidatus]